jgi:RNAse (barnase) inhibitor barstar
MAVVRLNAEQITDWASFHLVCKEAFGFPDFYGANMDAWIDCLTYLTQADGMTKFVLSKDEKLFIEVTNTDDFKLRLPAIFAALIECGVFVNNRYLENNETAKIALIFS